MSEHHKHTEFLKHCLGYDDSAKRHQMVEKLVRLQHELRIVRKAFWLVALLMVPAAIGFVFADFLLQHFSHNAQRSIMNIMLAIILGLVISLAAFGVMGMVLRRKLHRQREECHQFLKGLLAARLGPQPPK